jgi:predicted glycosyltransferase
MAAELWRVALYSPGIVGLGHMRRSLLIGQALAHSRLPVTILWIAESRHAGVFSFGKSLDSLCLPAIKKQDGVCQPRYLDIDINELVALRSKVIAAALEEFRPDAFIVDKLPRGALRELDPALELLRRRDQTRCVLGLRDVLDDPESVQRDWLATGDEQAIRQFYKRIWVYGDRAVYDVAREYQLPPAIARKIRYTGYLDYRLRLKFADRAAETPVTGLRVPAGQFALCLLGGGQDGAALAETFADATFPADMTGVILTGPFMPADVQARLRARAKKNPRLLVVDFVAEPAPLLERADRVVAMGGYSTVCESLSFEKHLLIVPRVTPRREQLIRAERLAHLNLVQILHPSQLSAGALSEWLACDLGPAPRPRELIQLDGLRRIPRLLQKLLMPVKKATYGPV